MILKNVPPWVIVAAVALLISVGTTVIAQSVNGYDSKIKTVSVQMTSLEDKVDKLITLLLTQEKIHDARCMERDRLIKELKDQLEQLAMAVNKK